MQQKVEELNYQKEKEKTNQLLIVYSQLLTLQESCWGKFFLFQKNQFFSNFNKKCSYKGVVQVKLQDIIYLLVLCGILLIFNLIASDPSHVMFKSYQTFCGLLLFLSAIVLFINHWSKYIALMIVCWGYPALLFCVYSNLIFIDPVDSSKLLYTIGWESLAAVYVIIIIVYPLKAYITQLIGSLYSFLYGLSVITLFFAWPLYSIIQEFIINSQITTTILFNNKALICTFISIFTFSFYLIVHNTFFQGNKQKIFPLLLSAFKKKRLIKRALSQISQNQAKQYELYNFQMRIMSFIILASTLGLQIYIFLIMSDNSSSMIKSIALMIFSIAFLLIGTIFYVFPLQNCFSIPIFTIISLVGPGFSFTYSQTFDYWSYIMAMMAFPYIIVFWSIIRSFSKYKPLLMTKVLVILYLFVHIPILVFVMDRLDYFGSGNTIGAVGYVALGIVLLTLTISAILGLFVFCRQIFSINKQTQKNTIQLDFNFEQSLDYKPYKKGSTFTLQWLSQLDLTQAGTLLNTIFFLSAVIVSIYTLNNLIYVYKPSDFYSSIIYDVTYGQIPMILVFYLYSEYYIVSKTTNFQIWIFTIWISCGIFGLVFSYTFSFFSFTFRMCGAFSLIMLFVSYGFMYVKESNPKVSPFLSPVILVSLWLTIIFPYIIMVPTLSLYVDQINFGIFIYDCILGSVVLMIFLVGVVSMIFNILMNKFQQQKRYKFAIQDVITYLQEQGIKASDEVLHVLHEAYQCRDKTYVFYLKNGYPVNVLKDSKEQIHTLVTYDNYQNNKIPTENNQEKLENSDCCWNCLTFCCGVDDDQKQKKMQNALDHNLINQEELEYLMPQKSQKQKIIWRNSSNEKKINKKNPSQIFSSKSLILKSLIEGPRRLGPQYSLMKIGKISTLPYEIWSSIFSFIANNDQSQQLIIFNDFKIFCRLSQFGLSQPLIQQIFNRYAKKDWGDIVGMNQQQFSCSMHQIAQRAYQQSKSQIEPSMRIFTLLMDKVYYNLAKYHEFIQYRSSAQKNQKFNMEFSEFRTSYQKYLKLRDFRNMEMQNYIKFHKKQHKNKLIQPNLQEQEKNKAILKNGKIIKNETFSLDQQEIKQKSCKKMIYQKYKKISQCQCCECCIKQEKQQQQVFRRRQKVKPWNYLAQEVARIIHRKSALWEDKNEVKQYKFHSKLNNYIMAIFKLADVYTYVQISIDDPNILWYGSATFKNLFFDYKYQLYVCLALAFITVPLGIKGISLIFEDRLGLTQARIPAAFPNPMYFYTVFYKLLILSMFSIISSTFLVTFDCTWTSSSPYSLYDDSSIQCLSQEHNIYMMLSVIFLIVYYPLSSYTMPNFQFSQKDLDLKYQPSYLVIYFQVNFVLAAGKVLLTQSGNSQIVELLFIAINLTALIILAISCWRLQPCLIQWFNWIQFLTIMIGIIWNFGGLGLYLTKVNKDLGIILCSSLTAGMIALTAWYIKTKFFSTQTVNIQNDQDEIKQLQMGLQYNQYKNKKIITKNKDKELAAFEQLQISSNQNYNQKIGVQDLNKNIGVLNKHTKHKNYDLNNQQLITLQQYKNKLRYFRNGELISQTEIDNSSQNEGQGQHQRQRSN